MIKIKIKNKYSAKLIWIPKEPDWVDEAKEWDGQWYYEIFHNKEKIGEAAFLEKDDSSIIIPCDFCDLAIEIDENHRRKGLGSFILKHIQKHTGKELYFDTEKEHSFAGYNLLTKNKISCF